MDRVTLPPSSQGLWFLSQTDADASAAYNVVVALRLGAAADPARLERALLALQRRHEALRMRIVAEGGVPHCEILEPGQAREWRLEHGASDLAGAVDEAGRRAFDMAVEPLARAVLVEGSALVFSFPHLVSDDASTRVFLRDFAAACDDPDVLAHAPTACSLREAMATEERFVADPRARQLAAAVAQRLEGIPAHLALPSARDAGDVPAAYPGAAISFALDAAALQRLQAFARGRRTTTAAVCLASWMLVLWLHSGQDDFGVCLPVSCRAARGQQDVLGYLTNLAVARARVDAASSVDDFVAAVSDQMWDLLDAAELPFPLLARQLKRSGGDLQGPLLQVAFNHVVDDGAPASAAGWARFERPPVRVKNQIKLDLMESRDRLRGFVLYDRDGIDPATAEGMARGMRVVLDAVMAGGGRRVRDLCLLDEAGQRAQAARWNDTVHEYPHDATLHALVERQAARTPDAVAVRFGEVSLSYAALDAHAGALARCLREAGAAPERIVAVCAPRSVELVVALLAVLKSGAAYLPLDPESPQERLAYMLDDSRAVAVLVPDALRARLPASSARRLPIELDAPGAADADADAPRLAHRPGQAAYCIYTSGSTGQPKAALNEHRAIVNRLDWMQRAYGLRAGDVVLQKTPFTFDVSVWEFFWPLIAGATLCVAEPQAHRDPRQLAELIERRGVDTVHFVPPMLQAFLEASSDEQLRRLPLRRIFCSGEALPAALVAQCLRRLPQAQLHNLYGPTECAVDVSHWPCVDAAVRRVPLGLPIANTRLLVLDSRCRPVPDDVAGELFIAGVAVGRGYLGKPALTADRFLPDPWGEPGSRMYRTGDIARRRPSGEIDFLGRVDHQVKLRGLRIELGEIEASLLRCPGVREAAVLAREDRAGDRRLVAYVVVDEAAAIDAPALRAMLARTLPDYMVPAAWVMLAALPLGANGKLDRKALPEPAQSASSGDAAPVAPRDELERRVCAVWAEVLGREGVGVHDNFFALGGHSLLAMQVLARLQRQGLPVLPMRVLFDGPTVAQLCDAVRAAGPANAPPPQDAAIPRLARTRA